MTQDQPIIVIGAGLAGLAAARRLQQAGRRVILLERAPVSGGRVCTVREAGWQFERGAEFLADFYTRTLALIDELGLSHALREIPARAAILRNGHLHRLWPNPRLALSPLIGTRQKLDLARLLADLARHAAILDIHAFDQAHPLDDRTIADYAEQHLTPDVLEYVIQPPLGGVLYNTPERTSHALLMLVLRAGLRRPGGMRVYTLADGLSRLGWALADGLDLRVGLDVQQVLPQTCGYRVVAHSTGGTVSFDAAGVVCATPASVVTGILPWLDQERRYFFDSVRYTRTAQLTVGMRRRLPHLFYGLLFPRRETPFLASATLQTVRDPGSAPPEHDLICLHMSDPAATALRESADHVLQDILLSEIRRVAPSYAPQAIVFQRLDRWDAALPMFEVGHIRQLAQLASGDFEPPQLVFAGDYLGGPFVEGAIVSGETAAERLRQQL
jgi:oxygen-dependent protoporphyrinogen oxidase